MIRRILTTLLLGLCCLQMAAAQQQIAKNIPNAPAPEFALKGLSGRTVHLSDFRGRAVVLNFWATWCEACRAEMPSLIKLQQEYGKQGLAIIGIAMDEEASPRSIGKLTRELGVNYTILIGNKSIGRQYGNIESVPATFFISRDGLLLGCTLGATEPEDTEQYVKKMLVQSDSTAPSNFR